MGLLMATTLVIWCGHYLKWAWYRPTNTKVGRKVTNGHVSTHTKHETQHLWQWMQKHFKQHMGTWSYAKFKMDAINIRTHVRNDVKKKWLYKIFEIFFSKWLPPLFKNCSKGGIHANLSSPHHFKMGLVHLLCHNVLLFLLMKYHQW